MGFTHGDLMKKTNPFLEQKLKNIKDVDQLSSSNDLAILDYESDIENIVNTNVVRVPFGVRQPKKQRPTKSQKWVTLVIPFNRSDSPNPPPFAA